jgi:hypothetical protein
MAMVVMIVIVMVMTRASLAGFTLGWILCVLLLLLLLLHFLLFIISHMKLVLDADGQLVALLRNDGAVLPNIVGEDDCEVIENTQVILPTNQRIIENKIERK